MSGRNHQTLDVCSTCLAQNAHHGNAFTVESEDGLPVLGTTDEQAENLCLPCLPEMHSAPCAASVSLPPAAVAVALPPAVPAPADAENEFISGSEPGDEVADVRIPKVTERPSVERLKVIARSISHQMTHWPYNSQCQFCVMCKKRLRQHRRRGPRLERHMDFLAHGYADHIVSRADLTRGYDGSNDAVFMRGGGDFRYIYPVRNISGPLAFNALREMYGPEDPRR